MQTPPSLPRPCTKVLTSKSLVTFFSLCSTKSLFIQSGMNCKAHWRGEIKPVQGLKEVPLTLRGKRDAQLGDTDLWTSRAQSVSQVEIQLGCTVMTSKKKKSRRQPQFEERNPIASDRCTLFQHHGWMRENFTFWFSPTSVIVQEKHIFLDPTNRHKC